MRDSLFSYELFALKKAFFSILENMHNSQKLQFSVALIRAVYLYRSDK